MDDKERKDKTESLHFVLMLNATTHSIYTPEDLVEASKVIENYLTKSNNEGAI